MKRYALASSIMFLLLVALAVARPGDEPSGTPSPILTATMPSETPSPTSTATQSPTPASTPTMTPSPSITPRPTKTPTLQEIFQTPTITALTATAAPGNRVTDVFATATAQPRIGIYRVLAQPCLRVRTDASASARQIDCLTAGSNVKLWLYAPIQEAGGCIWRQRVSDGGWLAQSCGNNVYLELVSVVTPAMTPLPFDPMLSPTQEVW